MIQENHLIEFMHGVEMHKQIDRQISVETSASDSYGLHKNRIILVFFFSSGIIL
jgi:transcription initiation factor TFIID subunit TAF12